MFLIFKIDYFQLYGFSTKVTCTFLLERNTSIFKINKDIFSILIKKSYKGSVINWKLKSLHRGSFLNYAYSPFQVYRSESLMSIFETKSLLKITLTVPLEFQFNVLTSFTLTRHLWSNCRGGEGRRGRRGRK